MCLRSRSAVGAASALAVVAGCNALSGVGDLAFGEAASAGATEAAAGPGGGSGSSSGPGTGGMGTGASTAMTGAGGASPTTGTTTASSTTGGGGGAGGGAAGSGGAAGGGGGACLRVFVSSAGVPGDFAQGNAGGARTVAQQFCQNAADAAGLGGRWDPWLSTSTSDARNELGGQGPWYRVDCVTLVATDVLDLTDGDLAAAVQVDENGDNAGNDAWTGTSADGTASSFLCADWTDSQASGTKGKSGDSADGWTNNGTNGCGNQRRLYCFER